MPYIQYTFSSKSDPEIVLAFLHQGPFEAFQIFDENLAAFFQSTDETQVQQYLSGITWPSPVTVTKHLIKEENWNSLWESNFEPVKVGNFCTVIAPFHHPETKSLHNIVIKPEMAFGTGHHETTFMMIELMEMVDFSSKRVLDFGCGTGILSILASFLGAATVDAVDNDYKAIDNCTHNIQLNKLNNINIFHTEIHGVNNRLYDIILANVNRRVILENMEALYDLLCNNSQLLLSGILKEESGFIMESLDKTGFSVSRLAGKGEWIAILANR